MKKMKKIYLAFFIILFLSSCWLENNYKKDELYKWGIDRLSNNVNNKWIFNYLYDTNTDSYVNKNNDIRQLLASRIIAYLSLENEDTLKLHKKNLDFIFKYWYKEDWEEAYIFLHNKSKIWANALFIRVLVYSPFFDIYKKEIDKLFNWIVSLQKENWMLLAWYKKPNYDYDENYLMYFYSWEVILSILELYEKTNEKKYLDFILKSQDYYYNEYINSIEKNYYPAYVPWHTFSLTKLYKITKDDKYLNAIFLMNDKLLELQETNKKSKYFGRFYQSHLKKYWSPHTSSDAIYTESLLYAYGLAKDKEDKKREKLYFKAINSSIDNLYFLQYKDKKNINTYWWIKINHNDNNIRVDNVAHLIDMLIKYNEI